MSISGEKPPATIAFVLLFALVYINFFYVFTRLKSVHNNHPCDNVNDNDDTEQGRMIFITFDLPVDQCKYDNDDNCNANEENYNDDNDNNNNDNYDDDN